jgi:putative glycosyltransferase (TIGR04372 family)
MGFELMVNIKRGNYYFLANLILFKKLMVKVIHKVSFLWAFPILIFLKLTRIEKKIRFIILDFDKRIGNQIPQSYYLMLKFGKFSNNKLNIFFLVKEINRTWSRLIKKEIYHAPDWLNLVYWNSKTKIIKSEVVMSNKHDLNFATLDTEGLMAKSEVMVNFDKKDNSIGKSWLLHNGWKTGQKIVSILVRDDAYLKQNDYEIDFSYHSYRDSDIMSYLPAIDLLLDRGYFVIRMGSKTNKDVTNNVNSKSFVDYSWCEGKSDLLDIWLMANSNLIISTGTGHDRLAQIYKIPMLLINYLPLYGTMSSSHCMNAPKKLFWEHNNEILDFNDYFDNSFLRTEDYLKNNIRIVDLDSGEILSIVDNFIQITNNDVIGSTNGVVNSDKLWLDLQTNSKFGQYHVYRNENFSFSEFWLKTAGIKFSKYIE